MPQRRAGQPSPRAVEWGLALLRRAGSPLETCRGRELVEGAELLRGQTVWDKPHCSPRAAWGMASHAAIRLLELCWGLHLQVQQQARLWQGCPHPGALSPSTAPQYSHHAGSSRQWDSSMHPPRAPNAPSCACNSLIGENLILPGPGLQDVTARCPSGLSRWLWPALTASSGNPVLCTPSCCLSSKG